MPNKFAILSDLMGERSDIPTVKMSHAFMPESRNVFLQYGMIRSMPGRHKTFLDADGNKVQTPDANPVIHYQRHVSVAGIEYEFAYTKDHVYRWNETSKEFELFFTCSSSCELWDSASINGKIVSTNGIDKVQVWLESTPGTSFANMGSASGIAIGGGDYITSAKYCIAFEGYLWLGYTVESAVTYAKRVRWSSYGDETDFDETGDGDTGAKDFNEGFDNIKGFGLYTYQMSRILVIGKEESIYAASLIESDEVWSISKVEGKIGFLTAHGVANDKQGNLYYIASDFTVQKFLGGEISQFKDEEFKSINISYKNHIEAAYISVYNQIWFSIPYGGAATGNNLILAYNINYGIWHTYDFDIRCFGSFSQQTSYTINSLDDLADTIDTLDAALAFIDSVETMEGYPIDLASDYSGYTYSLHKAATDKDAAMAHYFVIATDLANKDTLSDNKRFQLIRPMFKGDQNGNEVVFSVKENEASNYTNIGTATINTRASTYEQNISCDLRAKHFLFKGYSNSLFSFIGIFFPEFYYDGDD